MLRIMQEIKIQGEQNEDIIEVRAGAIWSNG
jgi:hypothetical protein